LSDKYNGIFKVAAVDCKEEEELCNEEFNIYKFPKVICYPARN